MPPFRLIIAAAVAGAPALLALAALVGAGQLPPAAALAAAAGVLACEALLAYVLLRGLAALRAALESLTEAGEAAPLLRSANPLVSDLWIAVLRLVRSWRQRLAEHDAERLSAQGILAALPDPVLLLDQRRRVLRANRAATAIFGGSLVDRDLAAVLRNPPLLAAVEAVLHGGGERAVELTLAQPVERQFSARLAPLAADFAGGAALLVTLHDLTAAKRSEQMRADFVANASHELRTPLATLLGFIETLRGPARNDRDAEDRFLAIMAEQAGRMARLVEDLLSLSRIEMNEHVTPVGSAQLGHVIGSVAATLELRAEARGMRVALDLPADLPAVQGDPDELAQVFQNLIDNAIKYGRERTAIEVAGRLDLGRDGSAPLVAIAVRDHGDGIPREHLPRLTERFYRVDTARSRAMGGTGLGLAIVKHIVNRHRGRLEIASELGRGSVVTVWLRPAAAATGLSEGPGERQETLTR